MSATTTLFAPALTEELARVIQEADPADLTDASFDQWAAVRVAERIGPALAEWVGNVLALIEGFDLPTAEVLWTVMNNDRAIYDGEVKINREDEDT